MPRRQHVEDEGSEQGAMAEADDPATTETAQRPAARMRATERTRQADGRLLITAGKGAVAAEPPNLKATRFSV